MRRVYLLWLLVAIYLVLSLSREAWAFSSFQRSLNDRSHATSVVREPVRAGRHAQRFELRPGDCGQQQGWSDCLQDRERIEFSQRPPYIALNTTHWFSWSLMLDHGWQDITPVTTTLGQFHHRDSLRPALLFVQRDGHYQLRIESAAHQHRERIFNLKPIDAMRAAWTDIVVEVRFSSDHTGRIRVWVDGGLTVAVNGPTTLETTPVFFKYGIYRSYVSRRPLRGVHVAYWDEVRWGRDRASVDPRVNPALRPVN